MYFWRIEKLKTKLAAGPLSEREALPYLVVYVALHSVIGYIPQTTYNVWDGLGAVRSVLLAALGIIYIYRQNGGGEGQHFLQRYFAVGWVVSIRWFAILLPAFFVFRGTLAAVGADRTNSHWYDFLFIAVFEAAIYWRIGHHVRDLAQRAAAA
jgi:hypothetical protein